MPIRPWGYGSQRFPPPDSRHDFHRALPPMTVYDSPHQQRLCTLPKKGASTPLTTRHQSRGFICIREVRSRRDGFTHIRRPIPSQPLYPPRISPLEPWPLRRKASSHGLSHNAGQVHRYGRSPEFQRTRGSLASFENCYPPWDLRPGNQKPDGFFAPEDPQWSRQIGRAHV